MWKSFWNDNGYMNDELNNKRMHKLIDYDECSAFFMSFFYYSMIFFSILVLSSVPYATYVSVVSPCLNETVQAKHPAAIVKNKPTDSSNNKDTFIANNNGSSTAYDKKKSTTYDKGRSTAFDDNRFIINCICKSVYKDFWKLTFVAILYIAMLVYSYKMLIHMKTLVSKHRKCLRAIYMSESKSNKAPFRNEDIKIFTKHLEKKMILA